MKKFLFLIMIGIFSACSNGIGSGDDSDSTDVSEENAFLMNRHSQNLLVKGDTIYNDVIASYKSVTDFYGDDASNFTKMVCENLASVEEKDAVAQNGVPSSFYDVLECYPEATFIIKFKDGTTLTADKEELEEKLKEKHFADKLKSALKTISICGKLPSSEKMTKKMDSVKDNFVVNKYNFTSVVALSENLKKIFEGDSYKTLFQFASSVSKVCSVFSAGIDILGSLGVLGVGGPDVTQLKLDYIIDMLGVMNEKLDIVMDEIRELDVKIEKAQNKAFQFDLGGIMSKMDGYFSELSSSVTTESKTEVADECRMYINGLIDSYIAYSMELAAQEKSLTCYTDSSKSELTTDYKDVVLSFNTPYTDNFSYYVKTFKNVGPGGASIPVYTTENPPVICDVTLAQVTLKNPNFLLPANYSHVAYLQNLIVSRMNMNSLVESDENLDKYNSNVAKVYLDENTLNLKYIGKLRESVNAAYAELTKELDAALLTLENSKNNHDILRNNITGVSWEFKGVLTKTVVNPYPAPTYYYYVVQSLLKSKEIKNFNANSGCGIDSLKAMYIDGTKIEIDPNYTDNQGSLVVNPYLLIHRFEWSGPSNPPNPLPVMSSDSYLMYNANFPVENGLDRVVYKFSQTLSSPKVKIAPYATSFTTLSDRAFGDNEAIDDAKELLIKTYRAKTQKLLEVAASLAATEIYLRGFVID